MEWNNTHPLPLELRRLHWRRMIFEKKNYPIKIDVRSESIINSVLGVCWLQHTYSTPALSGPDRTAPSGRGWTYIVYLTQSTRVNTNTAWIIQQWIIKWQYICVCVRGFGNGWIIYVYNMLYSKTVVRGTCSVVQNANNMQNAHGSVAFWVRYARERLL